MKKKKETNKLFNQLPGRINIEEMVCFFSLRFQLFSVPGQGAEGGVTHVAPTCRSLRKAGVN